MSGLFLRLAEQATGQHAATLHSVARLPYQTYTERVEQAAPSLPASAALPAEKAASWREPAEWMTGELQPAIPPLHGSPESPPNLARAENSTALPPSAFSPGEPAQRQPGSSLRQPGRVLPVQEIITPASVAQAKPAADPPMPESIARTSAELSRQPQAELPQRGEVHAQLRVPEQMLDTIAVPPPLLSANAAISSPAAVSMAPVAASAMPARAPDEVHIHIGRIEITAIQEPKPASRPARKGMAPLSLDDYLARRKGDGR